MIENQKFILGNTIAILIFIVVIAIILIIAAVYVGKMYSTANSISTGAEKFLNEIKPDPEVMKNVENGLKNIIPEAKSLVNNSLDIVALNAEKFAKQANEQALQYKNNALKKVCAY